MLKEIKIISDYECGVDQPIWHQQNPIELLDNDKIIIKLDFSKIQNLPDGVSNSISSFSFGKAPNLKDVNTLYFDAYKNGLVIKVIKDNVFVESEIRTPINDITIEISNSEILVNNHQVIFEEENVLNDFLNYISNNDYYISNGINWTGKGLIIKSFGYEINREKRKFLDYEGLKIYTEYLKNELQFKNLAKLYIGPHIYDGSEEVKISIYDGQVNE